MGKAVFDLAFKVKCIDLCIVLLCLFICEFSVG